MMVQPTINKSTIEFLKKEESVRYKAYYDSCHLLTIGVGHLILPAEHQQYDTATLTDQQVNNLLSHDLISCDHTIQTSVKVQLNQNQFDSICSFIFNEGQGAFISSTLLKQINLGASHKEIEDEFMKWDKAKVNGHFVELTGLLNRRKAEFSLFIS